MSNTTEKHPKGTEFECPTCKWVYVAPLPIYEVACAGNHFKPPRGHTSKIMKPKTKDKTS